VLRASLLMTVVTTLLAPSPSSAADASADRRRVGRVYEVTRVRVSASEGSDGSSSSSHDRDTIVERVIGLAPDGVELEYDLPKATPAAARAAQWQLPVRVLEPASGPLSLLNGPELEARVDPWLQATGMTRAACSRWIFTWNAFRIDCDPQSAIAMLEAFRLGLAGPHDGDSYRDHDGLAPGRLARNAVGPAGQTFTVVLDVDPDAVRRERARSDVVVAEIMREPTTFEAALREQAKAAIYGTISITFRTDSTGNILQRTRVANVEIREPNGKTVHETTTETVERRLASTHP
jgi:hypothetical protein